MYDRKTCEAFASYFGLGSLPAQFAAAELRHFWVAKVSCTAQPKNGQTVKVVK